jgi:serine/threonine protein kinase/Tol biopolymer transport system component
MTLPSGTRLGPYQILQPLGAGGMGEVYKARDLRLDRTVAIKVLPAHVATDPALRARFEREARVVSGLDHPNICVLYDVGREDGVEFLVMQYLEGETLQQRLARGPLPLEQVLRYGVEIAEALDKAHRAGVLHRDLKPGNVILTKSGAKLLDFGLAKLAGAGSGPLAQSSPATLTSPLTGQGTILGTLLYMSPEQLEGREVDARSDVFSFGAVLYEMATGMRAFAGGSQASVIGAILERDPPPLSSHAPLAPLALERIVRKCLAKDPDRRWQSARDLADELSWVAQSSGIQQQPAVPSASRRMSLSAGTIAAIAAGAVVVTAAIGAWAYLHSSDSRPAIARHFAVPPPAGTHFVRGGVAVSPDGSTIAFLAAPDTPRGDADLGMDRTAAGSQIYVRRLDADTSAELPGTDGALMPFFSPDGLWIGYFTETALMKVSVLGGTPVRIVGTPPVTRGGTWGPDDTIIFAPTQSQGLLRVPASGGTAQVLTTVNTAKGDGPHLWPQLLPDGKNVLFTIRRGTTEQMDRGDIAVLNVAGGEPRVIIRGGAYPRYSPTGHLLFVRGTTLMAVPFDATSRETKGTPLPIADGLVVSAWFGGAHYAPAADGSLLYLRGTFGYDHPVPQLVDRSGKPATMAKIDGVHLQGPRLSPDGRRALFNDTSSRGDDEIYVCDVSRGTLVALSADPGDDFDPIWNQDGTRVIWTSFRSGSLPTLVWRAADGSGATEPVVKSANDGSGVMKAQFAGSVSRDGVLAFTLAAEQAADIWVVPLTGDRLARQFIAGEATQYGPEFSPDGKWIAYVSNEAGPFDVYVAPYPGPGARRRISTGGGVSPAWSHDGAELFYQTRAGLTVVRVDQNSGELAVSEPRVLFKGNYANHSREDGPREYDVTRDGQHFLLMRVDPPSDKPATLNAILNWPAELARRTNPDKR